MLPTNSSVPLAACNSHKDLRAAQQNPTPDSAPPWYAVRVRTRSELLVAEEFNRRGISAFCPSVRKKKRYSDRIKTVQEAAFPGYVLCRLNSFDVSIWTIPFVDYVVGFAGKIIPIPDAEVDGVRHALAHGGKVAAYVSCGDRVVIESGPLRGLEGICLREAGCDRVVLGINLLQRAVSVEISGLQIRPIR